jgi:hypothetical protein
MFRKGLRFRSLSDDFGTCFATSIWKPSGTYLEEEELADSVISHKDSCFSSWDRCGSMATNLKFNQHLNA